MMEMHSDLVQDVMSTKDTEVGPRLHSHTLSDADQLQAPRTPSSSTTGSSSKLKRLSLVARPGAGASHRHDTGSGRSSFDTPRSAPIAAAFGLGDSIDFIPTSNDASASMSREPSEDDDKTKDLTSPATATPRARKGNRSSISYSPSVVSPQLRQRDRGQSIDLLVHRGSASNGGEAGRALRDVIDARVSGDRRGEERGKTLAEQHAELLTLIAQKERKVSELRRDLAEQETSLKYLKQRWTEIITESTKPSISIPSLKPSRPISHRQHPLSTSSNHSSAAFGTSGTGRGPISQNQHHRSPTLESSSSSQTTLSALSESPERSGSSTSPSAAQQDVQVRITTALDDIAENSIHTLTGLLSSAYGPEGVVSPAALEGGKRFWGQLVKTVSAAAAGNVPSGFEGAHGTNSVEDQSTHPTRRSKGAPVPANLRRLPSLDGPIRAIAKSSAQESDAVIPRTSDLRDKIDCPGRTPSCDLLDTAEPGNDQGDITASLPLQHNTPLIPSTAAAFTHERRSRRTGRSREDKGADGQKPGERAGDGDRNSTVDSDEDGWGW